MRVYHQKEVAPGEPLYRNAGAMISVKYMKRIMYARRKKKAMNLDGLSHEEVLDSYAFVFPI